MEAKSERQASRQGLIDDISLRRLGYATMLALVVLAAIFYRERAWFLDIAYQTFLLINEGTVQVMVNRFGAALVQLLPLAGIYVGAPLPVISLLYSISFPLLFLFFYFLTVRTFRNVQLGWALVFLYTLIVYDSFYWAISEQQQGLGAVLVFYAFWLRFPRLDRPGQRVLAAAGVLVLAYYHPLIFLSFYFLWAYFGLQFKDRILGKAYWLIALWMAVVLVIKSYWSANWYDSAKYSAFSDHLAAYFPRYWQIPANVKFLENAVAIWYFFPIFLLVVTVYYLYQRHWLKLALIWSACIGYLLIVHIGAPEATYRFYVEVNYLALTIFVTVPFLFEIAPRISSRSLFWTLLVIVTLRLLTIALHHQSYEDRWRWIDRQLASQPSEGNRFYLAEKDAPMDTLLMSWGTPYESLIITGSRHGVGEERTFLVHPEPNTFDSLFRLDSLLITPFRTFSAEELSDGYFPLPDGIYLEMERSREK